MVADDFEFIGPVRPALCSEYPLLHSIALEFALAYFKEKAYTSQKRTSAYIEKCRLHFDYTVEMDRWDAPSEEEYLERGATRFQVIFWPMVEWAITRYASVRENGIWRLRAHENVSVEAVSPRPTPRPVRRSSSIVSTTSEADRMLVDTFLRTVTPEPADDMLVEPSTPVKPIRIKEEVVSTPRRVKKLQFIKKESLSPAIKLRVKKESRSPSMKTLRVKKEEHLSPRVPKFKQASISPPSSPGPLFQGPSSPGPSSPGPSSPGPSSYDFRSSPPPPSWSSPWDMEPEDYPYGDDFSVLLLHRSGP